MIYRQLNLSTESGRLLPLLAAHAIEVFGPEANPDLASLFNLVQAKLVRVYVMEEGTKLLGYSMHIIQKDIFSAAHVQSNNMGVFIAHEARGSYKNIVNLIRFTEKQLTAEGVTSFLCNTNGQRGFDKLFTRLGYTSISTQYKKEI